MVWLTFSESLYFPQDILRHGGTKAENKLGAFPLRLTTNCVGACVRRGMKSPCPDQLIPWWCICSTQVEGDGVTRAPVEANLIYQENHEFYFPKWFGVNFHEHKQENLPTKYNQCPSRPVTCPPEARAENGVEKQSDLVLSVGMRDLTLWTCQCLSKINVSPQPLEKVSFPSVVFFLSLPATGSQQDSLHLPKKLASYEC